jgi:hypothetical protein
MIRNAFKFVRRVALLSIVAASIAASPIRAFQATSGPKGHWVGTLPAGPGLEMEFDIDAKGPGAWYGTMSVPAQGAKGVPLSDVSVKDKAISFSIKGAPGDPRFAGTLSADGKTINGEYSQSGATFPLTLAWKGEPKFIVAEKSTPITKDLEGAWAGALEVPGQALRLNLQLANAPGGATGKLISVDQNNAEIPIATIKQQGARVTLLITLISGTFEGELKNGELAGTWSQGQLTRPLVFKRPVK